MPCKFIPSFQTRFLFFHFLRYETTFMNTNNGYSTVSITHMKSQWHSYLNVFVLVFEEFRFQRLKWVSRVPLKASKDSFYTTFSIIADVSIGPCWLWPTLKEGSNNPLAGCPFFFTRFIMFEVDFSSESA